MRALPAFSLLLVTTLGAPPVAAQSCEGETPEWCDAYAVVAEATTADRRLNEVYRKLTRQLSLTHKKSIVSAQKAWVEFRRLDCEAELDLLDRIGSPALHQSVHAGCLKDRAEQRTKELLSYCESLGGCN